MLFIIQNRIFVIGRALLHRVPAEQSDVLLAGAKKKEKSKGQADPNRQPSTTKPDAQPCGAISQISLCQQAYLSSSRA
jgi:hypothetical protein